MNMVSSTEYPDLPFMAPRSWTNANRSSVQLIVIHTTEGSEHINSAEDGAAYDARRTDGTSTHYFHDSNSTVQCVRTEDIAHTAKGEGNRRGIHHELCGDAGDSAAEWADAYHDAMLRRAAKQAARDARKWNIPVRRLSAGQVAAGTKGICGHADISAAFGQSDHTDPGRNFPWSKFIGLVQDELEEDDMSVADVETGYARATSTDRSWMLARIAERGWGKVSDRELLEYMAEQVFAPNGGSTNALQTRLSRVEGEMQELAGKLDTIIGLLQPQEPPTNQA
jgi:N-acetyl-anhydromuramyl-L-alanine amidase AmpD